MSDDIDDPNLKRSIASSNEQSKLEATALNNMAVALVVAGVIAPIMAWAYDLTTKPNLLREAMVFAAMFWGFVAFLLHRAGKNCLRKLR